MEINMNQIDHIEIMNSFQRISKLTRVGNDYAKTPKSLEGDFKAAPLGEVWRGEIKMTLNWKSE
jgi:hypothetical protein